MVEALAKEIWTQHYLSIIGIDQIDYMLDKFQSELAISNDIECGYTYFIAYFDDMPCDIAQSETIKEYFKQILCEESIPWERYRKSNDQHHRGIRHRA